MVTERSEVIWGTTTIPYEIRRSSRRATVSLSINPVDGLLVTAPAGTPVVKLDAVVKAKARWVVERLGPRRRWPEAVAEREFTSGETFFYLGRQFRLMLVPGDPAGGQVALRGGWLEVPVSRRLRGEKRRGQVRAALVDWYRRQAQQRLPALAASCAERLGVAFEEVLVADQRQRWGSCSQGVLRFNWRVMQAPRRLVEYVVAHEVVHLVDEHHGKEFWGTLGRVMPDYEERRERLRKQGVGMVW